MDIDLKLPVQMVQQLIELVRNTPAPHAVTDPILRAVVGQTQPQIDAAQSAAVAASRLADAAPAPSRQVRRAAARKKA